MSTIERIVLVEGPKLTEDWDRYQSKMVTRKAKRFDVPFSWESDDGKIGFSAPAGHWCVEDEIGQIGHMDDDTFRAIYEEAA